ncbi:MAG: hypothetical protein KDD11_06710, partial [Acidobacteria bacterium]|nr:hypothetical protein [Acidobacteriota bacterium]
MQTLSTVHERRPRCLSLASAVIAGLLVALLALQPALAQEPDPSQTEQKADESAQAQSDDTASTEDEAGSEADTPGEAEFMDVIEVTGFRQSLEESVELKRDAVNARDSIVAEDIG